MKIFHDDTLYRSWNYFFAAGHAVEFVREAVPIQAELDAEDIEDILGREDILVRLEDTIELQELLDKWCETINGKYEKPGKLVPVPWCEHFGVEERK